MPKRVFGSDLRPGMVIDRMNLFVGETLWLGAVQIQAIEDNIAICTRFPDGARVNLNIAPEAPYWLAEPYCLTEESIPALKGGEV